MFTEKTVYELKTICMMYEIDYPKNAKKTEIIKALEDAGITIEKYQEDYPEIKEEYKEAEVKKQPEKIEVKEEVVVETKVQDKIVLKMIHPRGALNVGNGIVFTFEEPFKVLSEEIAKEVLRRAKNEVREATPEEVATFYGVI